MHMALLSWCRVDYEEDGLLIFYIVKDIFNHAHKPVEIKKMFKLFC